MTQSVRGDQQLIKAINRTLLLNILRRDGMQSRTQLTAASSLSVGAVSQIITELIDHNLIFESGASDYTGGRRQTLLRLNPDAGYALGLKVMETRVVCAVTDFEAKVTHYAESPMQPDPDTAGLVDALAAVVERTISETGIPRAGFFGVGVGLAGVIDSTAGVVHYSPYLTLNDVPLGALLHARLALPVAVDNDVNTLTLTEHLFGVGRHHANFVVVTVGRGVGMGMVLHGRLYQGARGGAGELGHTIARYALTPDGLPQGAATLESLASDPAVMAALDGAEHTFAEVTLAAAQGDAAARAALRASGTHIGIAIANLINLLNPSLLILSGEGVTAGDARLQPLLDAIRRFTFNGLLNDVQIAIEPADDQTWARGAAALVLNRVFAAPMTARQLA